MTCYQISQDGEPVALVADLGMARAIARCQPWGEYLVEEFEVDERGPVRRSRARKPPVDRPPARRRRVIEPSARWTHGIPAEAVEQARPQVR